MKRHGLLLLLMLLTLSLSLCACAKPEEPEDTKGSLEDLLQPNDKEPFTFEEFTLDGEKTEIWSEEATALLLERLGPVEEEISLPEYEAMELNKVYRLAGGSEMWCTTDNEDRTTPRVTTLLCVATDAVEVCGIKVGDPWTKVVESYRLEEPQLTENSWGETVWLLYGEIMHNQPQGFLALDEEGRPAYVFYGEERSLWFALDEEGAVKEIWYNAGGGLGGHYEEPETLYYYDDVAGAGAERCRGALQSDVNKPLSADYITEEGTTITVRYQMPQIGEGEQFTLDRTAEMQDAILLFLASPQAETVQFVYEYPLYDYSLAETPITRDMAKEALKAPLTAPGNGDWSQFDRQLREAYWYADTADTVDFDHIAAEASDPLKDNSKEPLTLPVLGSVSPWKLSEDGATEYLGTPSSAEDIPLFDGQAIYRVLTYSGGSMAGGWVSSSGKVESIGALYLTGDTSRTFCGIGIGDSADKVIRSFQVQDARETILREYGEERAIVLYGEVIHMGTYGYAVIVENGYTSIVYGAGEAGVVTFFLDKEEKVTAIRFQMEDHMRLPPEES